MRVKDQNRTHRHTHTHHHQAHRIDPMSRQELSPLQSVTAVAVARAMASSLAVRQALEQRLKPVTLMPDHTS